MSLNEEHNDGGLSSYVAAKQNGARFKGFSYACVWIVPLMYSSTLQDTHIRTQAPMFHWTNTRGFGTRYISGT